MSEPEKSELEKSILDFANQFMSQESIKGKARRIKIAKIVETVGFDMQKVKVAFLRSTINDRIEHD